jgi:hypothetical protein
MAAGQADGSFQVFNLAPFTEKTPNLTSDRPDKSELNSEGANALEHRRSTESCFWLSGGEVSSYGNASKSRATTYESHRYFCDNRRDRDGGCQRPVFH